MVKLPPLGTPGGVTTRGMALGGYAWYMKTQIHVNHQILLKHLNENTKILSPYIFVFIFL